jgi:hypothetical protein
MLFDEFLGIIREPLDREVNGWGYANEIEDMRYRL